ncbi:unnamed protein product [Rhizophagus irregularis]|nr:unnamed protein product [Rhizophagus irregularis]CAB4404814.1 unnamed protein product [Rhizophagus irregularis]
MKKTADISNYYYSGLSEENQSETARRAKCLEAFPSKVYVVFFHKLRLHCDNDYRETKNIITCRFLHKSEQFVCRTRCSF